MSVLFLKKKKKPFQCFYGFEIKMLTFLLHDLILLNYAGIVTDLLGYYTCAVICSILRLFQLFIELWVKY